MGIIEGDTVRAIARYVILFNNPQYTDDLLSLIPLRLLKKQITMADGNSIVEELDNIRFDLEDKMAHALELSAKWRKNHGETDILTQKLNSKIGSLPNQFEQMRKEIKFLFNVASIVTHW